MEEQKKKARDARKVTNYMGADVTVNESIDPAITSKFVGYDKTEYTSKISVLTTETELCEALTEGLVGTIIVDETPFYATMGGQNGDKGVITTATAEFVVEDTIKLLGGKIGHVGKVTKGMLAVGEEVKLSVDKTLRADTCKNHSATHLLQKALRTVLGSHVEQQGSLVTPDRLRFDFTHFQALTEDELREVESIVNEHIAMGLTVDTKEMTLEEAKKTGAMALFSEKYGETVRVVNMGDYSIELCGGTHVANTGNISLFKIVSESGIAAGVRRIEALTGNGVLKFYADMEKVLKDACRAAKSDESALVKKIESLHEEIKTLHSENDKLKDKLANNSLGDVMNNATEVNGFKVLATKVEGVDMNGLRTLGDNLKDKLGSGIVVLASATDGKVNLLAMATDDAVKAGAHAGNLIKAIAPTVGGGGGGRPNMAQAGGKNPEGIEEALKKAMEEISNQL